MHAQNIQKYLRHQWYDNDILTGKSHWLPLKHPGK